MQGRGGRKDKGKITQQAHKGSNEDRKTDGNREITTTRSRRARTRAHTESMAQLVMSPKKKKTKT